MYDTMITAAELTFALGLVAAALLFVLGMINPGWTRSAGRGGVTLKALGVAFLGFAFWSGVIAYTHMQPDGPHSLDTYLKDMKPEDWERLRQGQQPEQP